MIREQENERLRGLLQKACELLEEQDLHNDAEMLPAGRVLVEEIKAALSQQAEPAPAQDEREAFEAWMREEYAADEDMLKKPHEGHYFYAKPANMWSAWQARAAPIAQTAPQPEQTALSAVTAELEAERDQAREWLEEHYELEAERDQLRAEVETLRKDAERYRMFRRGMFDPDRFDADIDAMSAKEK